MEFQNTASIEAESRKLLDAAGLTTEDMRVFHALQRENYSIYIHGSLVNGELGPSSDVDFAVIGELSDLPPAVAKDLHLELDEDITEIIDYVSASMVSQNGRKMSFHLEKPELRENYPNVNAPIACEYRPASHAKKHGKNRYLLNAIDQNQNIYLLNVSCPQGVYGGGTINAIPQTGIFTMEDNQIKGGEKSPIPFIVEHISSTSIDGQPSLYTGSRTEIMLLGLEFDKMLCDVPLLHRDQSKHISEPIKRTINAVDKFIDDDSGALIYQLHKDLTAYRSIIKSYGK